jgi:outer membrane lipoprotein-sorting protein
VQDNRLKTFNRYPLGATPLALFLKRHVRLDQKVTVTRVERRSDGFSITARDGAHQAQGQITLVFDDSPLALTSWTIVDAQGGHTTVQLGPLKPTPGLGANLFVLKNPARVPAG